LQPVFIKKNYKGKKMTLSAIDLCSKALIKLGAFPISSMDGESPEEMIANHLYNIVKRQLLAAYHWNFATIFRELNIVNTKPVAKFEYSFQLPSDVISVITASDLSGGRIDYKIIGDELYTNSNSVILNYIYDAPEEYFSPDFQNLIIEKLASEFSIPLTENTAKANYFESSANLILAKAKSNEAMQNKPKKISNFPLTDIRN
jgi:hypothetical protein